MRSHAVRTKQPIWFVSSPKITPRYNLKVVTREFVIKDDYLQFTSIQNRKLQQSQRRNNANQDLSIHMRPPKMDNI